ETRMLTVEEIGRLVPALNLGRDVNMPVVGGYFHPPCGTARHDAVVWGLARVADRLGVDICPGLEVKGIIVKNDRVEGVRTDKGDVSARLVLNAAGGWSAEVACLAGVRLPVTILPLQAMVTEPIKPFLKVVLVSEFYFVYLHQTLKGEVVTGSHMDPYQSYVMDSNYDFVSHQAACLLELFPDLERVKLMRQWSGLTDMTPDHAPIMGPSPVEGFYLDVGWGYFGFKSGAVAGRLMAEYLATGKRPALISALGLERFSSGRLIQENVLAQT
ncbi:MAG: FAD-dependent oxidoreductase, partial [Thermodesulfobacteriota bacterium]